jgi:hypothetical protein
LKKTIALLAVLVIGALLFGCTGGGGNGGTQVKPSQAASNDEESVLPTNQQSSSNSDSRAQLIDMNKEYCGFKVNALTPEKIKSAGFTGELVAKFNQGGASCEEVINYALEMEDLNGEKAVKWLYHAPNCEIGVTIGKKYDLNGDTGEDRCIAIGYTFEHGETKISLSLTPSSGDFYAFKNIVADCSSDQNFEKTPCEHSTYTPGQYGNYLYMGKFIIPNKFEGIITANTPGENLSKSDLDAEMTELYKIIFKLTKEGS